MKLPAKVLALRVFPFSILSAIMFVAAGTAIAADSTAQNATAENNVAAISMVEASGRLVDMASSAAADEDEIGAIRLYHQAMVANPQNTAVYNGLGAVHVAHGRYQLGIKYFDTALKIDQVDLGALEGKTMAHLAAQNLEGANESFAIIQEVCAVRSCDALARVEAAIAAFEDVGDSEVEPEEDAEPESDAN